MLLVQCIEFVGEAEKCSGDVSSLVGCQFDRIAVRGHCLQVNRAAILDPHVGLVELDHVVGHCSLLVLSGWPVYAAVAEQLSSTVRSTVVAIGLLEASSAQLAEQLFVEGERVESAPPADL